MNPLLSARGLQKSYGALRVTDSVDLDIAIGEVHALIGPNGAGKTTLMGLISGEIACDAGRVMLAGVDVTAWPVHARVRHGLGRSYQITSIVSEFTVLENMLLPVQAVAGHSFRFWTPVTTERSLVDAAEQVLKQVGLGGVRHRQARLLSYGQQRQLELGMALATQPKVLMLDEPMAGLGPAETEEMIQVLAGIRKDYATLLVEHDMQAVFSLATQMSVLVNGKVVCSGPPHEIRERPELREAYLGDEEVVA